MVFSKLMQLKFNRNTTKLKKQFSKDSKRWVTKTHYISKKLVEVAAQATEDDNDVASTKHTTLQYVLYQ